MATVRPHNPKGGTIRIPFAQEGTEAQGRQTAQSSAAPKAAELGFRYSFASPAPQPELLTPTLDHHHHYCHNYRIRY